MTIRCFGGALAAGAVLVSGAGAAAAPAGYAEYQLQARTNFAVNPGGSYNVPPNYFFSGITPQLSDSRHVSFPLTVTPGDFRSVWWGQSGAGGIVYNTVEGAFLSGVGMNNHGFTVWTETDITPPGVYHYDPSDMGSGFLTNRPLGSTGWSTAQVNDDGFVGYRASFGFSGQAWISWDPSDDSTAFHAAETGVEPTSPYSFLFTPAFNNGREIAGKVRIGPGTGNERPDEIRIFATDGSSVLIAQDRDADIGSPYSAFDNSVALSDSGWVAFGANLFAGGRGMFLSDGVTTLEIARTTAPGSPVSNIEFFAPAVNEGGLVAFRAFDSSGLRAVWVGDGDGLVRVVTEHDILPSDLGDARVDQHDSSPVFGGGVSINESGEVSFNCGLTPPDNNQIEWGSGVWVAIPEAPPPKCPGDLDGDNDVDTTDLNILLSAFGCTGGGCPGDLDGDGDTDTTDLNILLSVFGAACP